MGRTAPRRTGPSPLRVATLVKALPPHRPGGLERHAWTLATGLSAAGHDVTVVTSAVPGRESEWTEDGVRVVPLVGTAPGVNSRGLFRAFARWVRLFDGEFDILHSQGFAALSAKPEKTPLVTTVHGTVWSETPLARQVRPRLGLTHRAINLWRFRKRTLMGPWVHALWGRSARLVCDSDFTRGELLHRWEGWAPRIDVVPLGAPLPQEVPPRDDDLAARPIRLLSVGRLERVRGLEDLFAAIALHTKPGRFELTVVGEGPDRRALEEEAQSWNFAGAVRFAGRLSDEDLAAEWARADLFVNPEWSQPAFGLVSLEALGWGLPVLGTETGATPEIVTPMVGRLVPFGEPSALGVNLAEFQDKPEMLLSLRRHARERAERFPVEAMVRGTERSFQAARAGV